MKCYICNDEVRLVIPVHKWTYCTNCRPFVIAVITRAQSVVRNAKKRGELRPVWEHWCADCNNWSATAYEHRHYSKPLEVTPVCYGCNMKRGPALDIKELTLAMMQERPELALKPAMEHEEI